MVIYLKLRYGNQCDFQIYLNLDLAPGRSPVQPCILPHFALIIISSVGKPEPSGGAKHVQEDPPRRHSPVADEP